MVASYDKFRFLWQPSQLLHTMFTYKVIIYATGQFAHRYGLFQDMDLLAWIRLVADLIVYYRYKGR